MNWFTFRRAAVRRPMPNLGRSHTEETTVKTSAMIGFLRSPGPICDLGNSFVRPVGAAIQRDRLCHGSKCRKREALSEMPKEVLMRVLALAILTTMMVSAKLAGAQTPDPDFRLPFRGTSNSAFQWNYSCPHSQGCSFDCSGSGSAASVTTLTLYLGSISVSPNQNSPALFYEFATRDIPRGHGFIISTGLSTLSCQINGMTLDYSGPLK